MAPDPDAAPAPGMIAAARRLARTALSLIATRLRILGTEVEEEQMRITELLLLVASVVFCLGTAVLLGVIFVVVLLWDTHRLATLGVFTVLFAVSGIVGLLAIRRRTQVRPKLFSATLGELAKDLDRLRGKEGA